MARPTDAPEDAVEVPPAFCEAIAKQNAARPSASDIADALPEECAVEVDTTMYDDDGNVLRPGETRLDYKKIPIRNGDGTLNKYGKNLLDLHRPANLAGADIIPKLQAGDFAARPQALEEVDRKYPLDPRVAERVAERRGLRAAPRSRRHFRGRSTHDEAGQFNLWIDPDGRLRRMAFVGTSESQRVVTYPA